jgi:hypothetical protein
LNTLIEEKLKGHPGLRYDGVGTERTTVIELEKVPPRIQRTLRRLVTMKLNEMKGQASIEKLRKIAKQDQKARVTEEEVEKLLAERKKLREKQQQQQQRQMQQQQSGDDNSSDQYGDEEDSRNIDKYELARLRELKERDDQARRMLELIAMDGGDDSLD